MNFKTKLTQILAVVCIIVLTSAVPVNKEPLATKISKENLDEFYKKIELYSADGKLTSKELIDAAKTLKGKELSFKEKMSLKLFNKKISQKVLSQQNHSSDGGGKSQVVALILCALVGSLGIHRFYLGYTWQGIVQFLTLGLCGIWSLIDLIRIITGDLQPKDGSYDKTL